ncbi:MAG: ATP-dependent helicase [Bacteroidetes Order II. Incertae sedis bacterium]|nr:ATP-dependent helicase [Bacteroidetes Order II. bacterium]
MTRSFVLKPESAPIPSVHYQIPYAEHLNPQQLAVVEALNGPALVIAGAGTGKTRTLIYRLARLVESGIPPEEIVLLTFTRRAAREMLNRATTLLDGRCEGIKGGTFHGFCLSILQRFAPQIGFPARFSVLDAADAADVVDLLRTQRGLHRSKTRFPKKDTLYHLFSASVNRQKELPQLLAQEFPQHVRHEAEILALYKAYDQYKQQHGLMDYDDLLVRTLQLFEAHPTIRYEVCARIRHVLVDEFQDTNKLQGDLVAAFASVHRNVMAVGDDAQSIYAFRGANFQNIMGFPTRFSGTTLYKLEENYRSTPPILHLANYILSQAHERYEKELFSRREGGELPAIVQAPDDRFQSRFVCQMVLQLREEGVPLHEMAVLFRNGRDSYDLELELAQRNIPFVKFGGLKLNDAAHIKDVLAHLKIAENPLDVVAWQRVLLLLKGIGPKTAQELIAWVLNTDRPYDFDSLQSFEKYAQQLRPLALLLQELRKGEHLASSQVSDVIHYYGSILERVHPDDTEKRRQDLEHFIGIAANFATRRDLLSALALDPIERSTVEVEATQKDEAPLVLSTIHSAKGLEYQAVFITQALEGVLPSGYALNNQSAIDEERRLLYVALTRAKDYLFVSHPVLGYQRSFGGEYFTKPSRFIQDIPEHLAEPWQLVESAVSNNELPTSDPHLSLP